MTRLQRKIESERSCNVIFTDLFDTLVHRKVHPNYTLKLWAKFVIRELGLFVDTDTLYSIRAAALRALSQKQHLKAVEVDYQAVIAEVYHRLITSDALNDVSYQHFQKIFEQADYEAEISVQFKNEGLIADLQHFKEKGYRIYLISDFYLSEKVIARLVEYHGLTPLFEAIFISCSLGKSKEKGSIYPFVLNRTGIDPKVAIMIGDNKKSDVLLAEKHGIKAIHLKHISHKIRNKKNLFGTDAHDFEKVCTRMERECRKSPHPFSEYVLHFYFFTERLYIKAKKNGIKNFFFLAREGLYLKRLFDAYQEMNGFTDQSKINTHYLEMSRNSALKIALRPLQEEDFSAYKGALGRMSVLDFLNGLGFSEGIIKRIIDDLSEVPTEVYLHFFQSDSFLKLRKNALFRIQYEHHRQLQKTAFNDYIRSFDVDFEQEGIHLVDVGWGGTMQENLYRYLEKKIPVYGYYLGLKEVYDIQPDTKRYGLNFSVYPSRSYSDEVLKANGQLYEQLLSAPHGTTVGYSQNDSHGYAERFHEEHEKKVFENLIRPVQEFMFAQFEILFESLRPVDYSQDLAQSFMTKMALRSGIFGKKQNIEFVDRLSRGFYQNIGQNKVGVAYSPKQLKESKMTLLAQFIKSPEKLFRYLVKIKPFMYSKGLYSLSWLVNLTYYYIKFNFWFKKKWMGKGLIS